MRRSRQRGIRLSVVAGCQACHGGFVAQTVWAAPLGRIFGCQGSMAALYAANCTGGKTAGATKAKAKSATRGLGGDAEGFAPLRGELFCLIQAAVAPHHAGHFVG